MIRGTKRKPSSDFWERPRSQKERHYGSGNEIRNFYAGSRVDQSRRNCFRNRRPIRVSHQPKARSLDRSFSVYDGVDEHNGISFPVYGGNAGDKAGNHLTGGAGPGIRYPLPPTPNLEEDL